MGCAHALCVLLVSSRLLQGVSQGSTSTVRLLVLMNAPSRLQAHTLNRLEEGVRGVYADPHLSAFLLFGHDSQCREWSSLVFYSSDDNLRHDTPENTTVAAMTEDVDPKPAIWRGALFLQASDCFMNNFASMYVSNLYDLQTNSLGTSR